MLSWRRPSLRRRTSRRRRRFTATWPAPPTHRTSNLFSTRWRMWLSPTTSGVAGFTKKQKVNISCIVDLIFQNVIPIVLLIEISFCFLFYWSRYLSVFCFTDRDIFLFSGCYWGISRSVTLRAAKETKNPPIYTKKPSPLHSIVKSEIERLLIKILYVLDDFRWFFWMIIVVHNWFEKTKCKWNSGQNITTNF